MQLIFLFLKNYRQNLDKQMSGFVMIPFSYTNKTKRNSQAILAYKLKKYYQRVFYKCFEIY